MEQGHRRGIQSVERALRILEVISQAKEGASLSEISGAVGLNHSTAHNLLLTLKQCEYVFQPKPNGRYYLGYRALQLSSSSNYSFPVNTVSRPHLADLVRKYDETAHLAILSDGQVVYMNKVESSHMMGLKSYVGKRNPCHATALGKALLASLDPGQVDEIIAAKGMPGYTPYTITTAAALHKELEQVRRQGYAVDNEEFELGLWCVAAPVRDYSGRAIAAISVTIPVGRAKFLMREQLIQDVAATAKRISQDLGWMEPAVSEAD